MEYIKISQSGFTKSLVNIKTEREIFDNPIIVKVTEGYLKFKVPSIDFRGKARKLNKSRDGYYQFRVSEVLKEGTYQFEEENEDILTIYF